jgi:cytoskeletal protein RodZ
MTLGAAIRSAREAAHISIEDLSAATSVRIGLLTEIESNNFEHCGGDTYARGHIRTLASKLGADASQWIAMYEEEHSQTDRNISEMLVENNVAKVPHEKKTMSWKVPASVSLIVVLTLAIVQIIVTNTSKPAPVATPSAVASAEPTESAVPSESPSSTISPVAGQVVLEVVASRGNSQVDFVVDGEHLYKGPMLQGDKKSFTGKTSISIYFSNPAGLDVTLNGSLLPSLGGENQEVRRTFRAQ